MNRISSASNHVHPINHKNHRSDKKTCQPLANFKNLPIFANELQEKLMNIRSKYRLLLPADVLAAGETLPTPPTN
jgi:hypothetical protein